MYQGGAGAADAATQAPSVFAKAAALGTAGCERDDAFACRALADMESEGDGMSQDKAAAATHYTKACNLGDTASCSFAADLLNGAGQEEKATALRTLACDRGRGSDECFDIGLKYKFGKEGYPKDDKKAVNAFRRACNYVSFHSPRSDRVNAVKACTNLAGFIEEGRGTAKSHAATMRLVRKVCLVADDGTAQRQSACDYMRDHFDDTPIPAGILLGESGSLWGKTFPLRGPVTIGSEPGVTVLVKDDPSVAPRHCELGVDAKGLYVKNLGSGATVVNGRRSVGGSPTYLRDGASVSLGEGTQLRVRADWSGAAGSDEPASAPAPASRGSASPAPKAPACSVDETLLAAENGFSCAGWKCVLSCLDKKGFGSGACSDYPGDALDRCMSASDECASQCKGK